MNTAASAEPASPKQIAAPFDPANAAYRRRLWVRLRSTEGVFYHVFWRRIGGVLLVAVLLAWLAGATGLWWFVRSNRGHARASWVDVAFYPLRAAHYRTSLGRHYLAQGALELEKKNYRTGHALLLAGLARVPDDLPARRLVAFTQIRLGRTDHAWKTLADGALLARGDLDYLKLTFGLMLEAQEDERALALATTLLPAAPDANLAHRFIALQAATAHHHRGRYDFAEDLVLTWGLVDSLEGQILLARREWEQGDTAAALARLTRQLPRFPRRDELHVELIRHHRELGHAAEARRHALLRQFNATGIPGPRIDLLHAYRNSGETEAEQRELAAYLATFGADAPALTLLAWFAVDTQQPELAWRIRTLAREQGFALGAHDLASVQAAVAAHDYSTALARADAAIREKEDVDMPFIATLNGLRAVALFGLGDLAGAHAWLASFLKDARPRAVDALVLARELRGVDALGAKTAAREVLAHAARTDPLDQRVLTELVRLDLASGEREKLAVSLPALLRTRKPPRVLLEQADAFLASHRDATLREKLDTALLETSVPAVQLPTRN